MSTALKAQDDRLAIYNALMATEAASPNRIWLAEIIASWRIGLGTLPDCLGLTSAEFKVLTDRYFPGCPIPERAASGKRLDFSRMLEKDDLIKLLKQFAEGDNGETDIMIGIVVAGCLGQDHLWQDLGLWSRPQLSAMLQHNFPELAAKNTKDMKWKKFLYKQLCEMEGLYLCRAPSCDVCIDYAKCYGPEH